MPPDRSSRKGHYRRTDDPAYESRIQAGMNGVASGKYTTLKAAALEENVAYSTLTDRARGQHISWEESCANRQLLSPAQEDTLLDWCDQSASSGKPYTSLTLRSHARNISGEFPGRRWHKNFERRHPALIGVKPSKLDPKRAKNFNEFVIGDYYDKQEDLHEKHDGVPPEHMWNMDEKGVQMGGGRKNNGRKYYFLRKRHSKKVPSDRYRISSDNLELVTILECISAAGDVAPPSFVLTKGPLPDLRGLEYPIGLIGRSESGWTDNEYCAQWLEKVFIPYAYSKRVCDNKPIILTMDGHESHETPELKRVIYNFKDIEIIIFCFPSKTTHKTQPLDVGVFNSVQRAWQATCDRCIVENITINRYTIIQEYVRNARKCITPELIKKAFEKTGIYPLNQHVFTKEDFAPSMASSSLAYVPISYPEAAPTSDPAIPSDAESEDEGDSDDDFRSISDDSEPSDRTTQDFMDEVLDENDNDQDSHTEVPGMVSHPPPVDFEEDSATHPRVTRSTSLPMIEVALHPPKVVSLVQDETLSPEQMLQELRAVRFQLWQTHQTMWFCHSQLLAANAHCTIIQRELGDVRTQLANEQKKKARGSSKNKARIDTASELEDSFNTEEIERVEKERVAAEKGKEKEASTAARAVRIARDITLKEYNAPLSSLKRKEEFLALAGALELSDAGTISDLTKRIKDHLDTHPELAEQQRFAGLYKAAGSRRQSHTQTAIDAVTAGPSNITHDREMDHGPPVNSVVYPPAPAPYQLQNGLSFISQSQHPSSYYPSVYPTAQVATTSTAGPVMQPQFLPPPEFQRYYYNPYHQVPP